MKPLKTVALTLAVLLVLTACGEREQPINATDIRLDDQSITANGVPVGTDTQAGIYTANDIVYHEGGHLPSVRKTV